MTDTQKQEFKNILIQKFELDEDKIKPDCKFSEDLGLDSLDFIEMIMEVESHFKISIPDADAEKVYTVQEAQDLIEQNL